MGTLENMGKRGGKGRGRNGGEKFVREKKKKERLIFENKKKRNKGRRSAPHGGERGKKKNRN